MSYYTPNQAASFSPWNPRGGTAARETGPFATSACGSTPGPTGLLGAGPLPAPAGRREGGAEQTSLLSAAPPEHRLAAEHNPRPPQPPPPTARSWEATSLSQAHGGGSWGEACKCGHWKGKEPTRPGPGVTMHSKPCLLSGPNKMLPLRAAPGSGAWQGGSRQREGRGMSH